MLLKTKKDIKPSVFKRFVVSSALLKTFANYTDSNLHNIFRSESFNPLK